MRDALSIMIAWADGVERTRDGAPLRELVQPALWTSSVWVTPDGACYRRYYNPVARAWGEFELLPASLDHATQQRLGFQLATGWASVETCIATAWLHRAPDSRARVLGAPGALGALGAPDVRSLAWAEGEEDPEAGEFGGETWAPLRWRCGAVECDARYRISSHGRLRNPRGGVTRGFAAHGSRWAACRGAGLVDLWQASGLARAERAVPERHYLAYVSLSAGVPPHEHARRHGLSVRTAWAYFQVAAPLVDRRRALGRALVDADLWRALAAMAGDERLGGRLAPLHAAVRRRLGRDVDFDELRFARTCLV